jgi:hypothetical protein
LMNFVIDSEIPIEILNLDSNIANSMDSVMYSKVFMMSSNLDSNLTS